MLEHGEDLADVLQRLIEIAGRLFPPGYEASITIVASDDQPETAARQVVDTALTGTGG